MTGLQVNALPLLAEAAPFFLMSVVKPLVTLALFVPYGVIVSGRLAKDAGYYNLKPQRWSMIFLSFAAAAFLAVILLPWWAAGVSLQVALLATPCIWYVKYRNKEVTDAKPITLFDIDLAKASAARRARSARSSVVLRFLRKDRTEQPVPEQKEPGHAVYLALQDLLMPALEHRTQRLDLALGKQGAAVGQMVDNIRAKRNPLPPEQAGAVVDLLKSYAGLEPNERRKYQRGTVAVMRGEAKTILTVSSMGSMQGENIRVDVEREKQLSIPLEKLGFLEPQLKLIKDTLALQPPGGVILAGARPGNGATTLGYSLISAHDAFTSNIKTLERRPERQVDGVEHSTFDPSKAEFSTQLQSIIRRGPDVVLVTDAGEPGVGKVLAAPGARASVIYVMLPSDSPIDMLAAWAKTVGDPAAASEVLKLLVAGRLMRRLCSACRVAYQPTPEVMKMLAIPAGKQVQLYRHSGKVLVKDQPVDCPTCSGSGYLGLTGAFEVLAFDEQSRQLLKEGDPKSAYMQARRANRSLSLQEAALMKVRAGETSLDEVKRVFAAPAPAAAPAAGTSAARPPAASAKPPAAK